MDFLNRIVYEKFLCSWKKIIPTKLLSLTHHIDLFPGWSWMVNHYKRFIYSVLNELWFHYMFSHAYIYLSKFYFFGIQDFMNFKSYICRAYKGTQMPEACQTPALSRSTSVMENSDSSGSVCYAAVTKN